MLLAFALGVKRLQPFSLIYPRDCGAGGYRDREFTGLVKRERNPAGGSRELKKAPSRDNATCGTGTLNAISKGL